VAYVLNNEQFEVRSMVAGETLAAGNVVFVHTDGTVKKATAASGTANVAVGIVIDAAGAGNSVDVFSHAIISGFSGLTVGSPVYLSSSSAGAVTSTSPRVYGDRVQVLGVALAADLVKFSVADPGYLYGAGNDDLSALAGENLTAGNVVFIHTDGTAKKALSTVSTMTSPAVGFAKNTAAAGAAVQIQRSGVIGGFSGLTVGSQVFVDEGTSYGGITQTAPSTSGDRVQCVGTAISATEIAVQIDAGFIHA